MSIQSLSTWSPFAYTAANMACDLVFLGGSSFFQPRTPAAGHGSLVIPHSSAFPKSRAAGTVRGFLGSWLFCGPGTGGVERVSPPRPMSFAAQKRAQGAPGSLCKPLRVSLRWCIGEALFLKRSNASASLPMVNGRFVVQLTKSPIARWLGPKSLPGISSFGPGHVVCVVNIHLPRLATPLHVSAGAGISWLSADRSYRMAATFMPLRAMVCLPSSQP